jgi:hypothetical protein
MIPEGAQAEQIVVLEEGLPDGVRVLLPEAGGALAELGDWRGETLGRSLIRAAVAANTSAGKAKHAKK